MAFRHTPYHMLIEAFSSPGCPVCRIVQDEVFRSLDHLIHENVNDLEFRDTLRRAGGFCNTHAWWLVKRMKNAALGATIMYRDVLNTRREELARQQSGSGGLFGARKRQAGVSDVDVPDCPACQTRARIEAPFISTFISHTSESRFVESYGASAGLCLLHLNMVLAGSRDTRATAAVLEAHDTIIGRLIVELDEFQRKSDYRFQDETIGAEADAWQRAIELVDGADGIR